MAIIKNTMLEKPPILDETIITALREEYNLQAAQLAFLPLGADQNTAVYRLVTTAGAAYFVKLRGGVFDETSVTLPRFLSDQGVAPIIAPLANKRGQLWAGLGEYRLILYPFIEGRSGFEVDLSDRQWIELGAALKKIHTMDVPLAIAGGIRRETYSPLWREKLVQLMGKLEGGMRVDDGDGPAVELAAFLKPRRAVVLDLAGRAERLAQRLKAQPPPFVLCHSDLHAGNILVESRGALYIVDWDDPILAPKERDLMYPGGAQGFSGHSAEEEEALFYQGYGPTQVDGRALAYYRCERIVQDLAIYCEQLFLTRAGGEDRQQSLQYLKANFLPHNTIEAAYRSEKSVEP